MCLGTSHLMAQGDLLSSSTVSPQNGWMCWMDKSIKDAGVSLSWADDKLTIEIPVSKKKNTNCVQVYTNTDALVKGKKYRASFELEAVKPGVIKVAYILGKMPFCSYESQVVEVNPDTKTYSCILEPKEVNGKYETPRSLRFFIGKLQGSKVVVGNVKIEEVQ